MIHSEDWTDNDFNDLIVKVVPLQGRSQFAQGGSGKDRIRQVGGWDNDWLDAQGGGGNDRIRQRGDGGDDVLRAFGGAGRDRLRQPVMVAMIAYLLEAVEVETVFVSVAAEAEMCFEQLAAVAETLATSVVVEAVTLCLPEAAEVEIASSARWSRCRHLLKAFGGRRSRSHQSKRWSWRRYFGRLLEVEVGIASINEAAGAVILCLPEVAEVETVFDSAVAVVQTCSTPLVAQVGQTSSKRVAVATTR